MCPRHPDAQPPNLIVIKSSVHRFIQWQGRLSRQFDRLLPDAMSVDGNYEFRTEYAISHLRTHPNPVVYDVGGGKIPTCPSNSSGGSMRPWLALISAKQNSTQRHPAPTTKPSALI